MGSEGYPGGMLRLRHALYAAVVWVATLALAPAPSEAAGVQAGSRAAQARASITLPGPALPGRPPAAGDYCTFATCAPRRSHPLASGAGFGLAIAAAAFASRQRSRTRRP